MQVVILSETPVFAPLCAVLRRSLVVCVSCSVLERIARRHGLAVAGLATTNLAEHWINILSTPLEGAS